MTLLFTVTIPGRVAILKSRKKLVRVGNRMIPVSSDAYKIWEAVALVNVRQAWGGKPPITVPVIAEMHFYFENKRGKADLSNCLQGPEDVLQKAGVLFDDSLIEGHDGSRRHFGYEPRTEIKLYSITRETT